MNDNTEPNIDGNLTDEEKHFIREQDKRDRRAIEPTPEAIEIVKRQCGAGIPARLVATSMRLTTKEFTRTFGKYYLPDVLERVTELLVGDGSKDNPGVWTRARKDTQLTKYLLDNVAQMTTAMEESDIETNQGLAVMGTRRKRIEDLHRRRQLLERQNNMSQTVSVQGDYDEGVVG